MTAAAFDHAFSDFGMPRPAMDQLDEQAARFDDTDGAYATAEPDPFAESDPFAGPAAGSASPGRPGKLTAAPHRHPSLRAELRATPAGPVTGLARAALPALPVLPGLEPVLPDGLRRGSTIAVTGSVSLLLAVLGGPSRTGAWSALVGMPAISAEAAAEAGIDLERLAIISPLEAGWTSASWTTAVGALLDAVDIVVARPGITRTHADTSTGVNDGDARRLTARARNKDAVLVLFGQQATTWPSIETQLSAAHGGWTGIGEGHGRLTARRLLVSATGRGRSARPRSTELWLPANTTVQPHLEPAPTADRRLPEAG